jgi:LPXTG-site transpeptidase (sortase) family protein
MAVKKSTKKKQSNKKPAQKKQAQKKQTKRTARRFWSLAGPLLILLGLLMGGYGIFNSWLNNQFYQSSGISLASNKPIESSAPRISGIPKRIQIPSVGIDLKVIPGYYNAKDQSWTLSLNNAQWGAMTARPNNKEGLTFIYAHYRKNVFYTLPHVTPGATAIVTTQNGHVFTYKFKGSTIVKPQNTNILSYKGKPILLLQTCNGVWYENRQLFVFDFVSGH